jgi:hypothetical protein
MPIRNMGLLSLGLLEAISPARFAGRGFSGDVQGSQYRWFHPCIGDEFPASLFTGALDVRSATRLACA